MWCRSDASCRTQPTGHWSEPTVTDVALRDGHQMSAPRRPTLVAVRGCCFVGGMATSSRHRPAILTVAGVLVAAALAAAPPASAASDKNPPPPVSGGPGSMSHYDLARKDCLGTAENGRSKVWFTVAGGVLSDVY